MRIANLKDRLVLVRDDGAIDVERASGGLFSHDPQAVYAQWEEFRRWAGAFDGPSDVIIDIEQLGAPAPRPRQVFAIGLNYAAHAAESGVPLPPEPSVFTKYADSLVGPHATVELPTETVDWEVELVAVIGRETFRVAADEAWNHVAGLTVGQDLSERTRQLVQPVPQFSIGKSFPGFGPTGPWVVTLDELEDPDDLALGCRVNGVEVQSSRTTDLIFSVPELVARLSAILQLHPGDLIFTGTPSGVGHGRDPQHYLAPGDVLESWVEGLGDMRTTFTASRQHTTRHGTA